MRFKVKSFKLFKHFQVWSEMDLKGLLSIVQYIYIGSDNLKLKKGLSSDSLFSLGSDFTGKSQMALPVDLHMELIYYSRQLLAIHTHKPASMPTFVGNYCTQQQRGDFYLHKSAVVSMKLQSFYQQIKKKFLILFN